MRSSHEWAADRDALSTTSAGLFWSDKSVPRGHVVENRILLSSNKSLDVLHDREIYRNSSVQTTKLIEIKMQKQLNLDITNMLN